MDFKFFRNRIKVSLYSIGIFAFFLLVSLVSLYIVREKILDNSHIMGQQLAARFATRETGRIKAQCRAEPCTYAGNEARYDGCRAGGGVDAFYRLYGKKC